jgi:hypothetical protein
MGKVDVRAWTDDEGGGGGNGEGTGLRGVIIQNF